MNKSDANKAVIGDTVVVSGVSMTVVRITVRDVYVATPTMSFHFSK